MDLKGKRSDGESLPLHNEIIVCHYEKVRIGNLQEGDIILSIRQRMYMKRDKNVIDL